MDEDLMLINELVDSDDDIRIEADLFFSDLHVQDSRRLIDILYPQLTDNNNYSDDQEITSSNAKDLWRESEEDFIQLYRVKQPIVEIIAAAVRKIPEAHQDLKIPPEEQSLAVLYFLSQDTISIEDVCYRFKIRPETFEVILNRVTAAVCSLSHKKICWPTGTEKQITKRYFAKKKGPPGVIGCIDTLPIKVLLSKEKISSSTSTQNSVVLQAVVNENKKFLNIFVSNTTATDTELFLKSPLSKELPTICSGKEYILGGATYPCLEHLLTPYPDLNDLSGDKIFFNLSIAERMLTTDSAFTLLSQRFRKLLDLKLTDRSIADQLITACCILHNMGSADDFKTINEPPNSKDMTNEEYSRENSAVIQHTSASGLKLRDEVCRVMK